MALTQVQTAMLGTGSVLQVVQSVNSSTFSSTSTSFVTTGKSITITPKSATSKILVMFVAPCYTQAVDTVFTLYRNNSTNIGSGSEPGIGYSHLPDWSQISMVVLDSPATTSATTYTAYGRMISSGTWYYGLSTVSTVMIAMEIAG